MTRVGPAQRVREHGAAQDAGGAGGAAGDPSGRGFAARAAAAKAWAAGRMPEGLGRRVARWATRRRAGDLAVAAGYLLLAVFVLKGLWAGPGSRYLVDSGQDQNQWEWFFAVTAHAVTHGENPLFTTAQNHPDGVNLMANTVMLGVSVPLAPVTALCGPGLTWALVLTCGLAGTAAGWYRVLAAEVVGSRAAAALGGAFCGFAPPMISHANAHPNFVALFVVPFLVRQVIRLCRGTRPGRDGVVLGLLAAFQVFLGEEPLLLTATGLTLFLAAFGLLRPERARAAARPLLTGLGVALAVCLPLVAYPLAWQFHGPQSYDRLLHGHAGNDVLALFSFAGQSVAGDQETAARLSLNRTEENAFFGWPLAVLLVAIAVWLRRVVLARALGLVVLAAALLSLGPEIVVDGERTGVPGPWWLFARLPLFESVLESRMTMICVPAIGVLLALAAERARVAVGPGRYTPFPLLCGVVAGALALGAVAPTPLTAADRLPTHPFYAEGLWRDHVRPGRTLVPVPPPGTGDATALHAQVAADFGFNLPEGYFVGPWGGTREGAYGALRRPTSELLHDVADTGRVPRVTARQRREARADLAHWRADAVVLGPHPRRTELHETVERLLGPGEDVGGLWVWDVAGSSRTAPP
ncbi:glycosyl transferase [Streptomyces capparidis]